MRGNKKQVRNKNSMKRDTSCQQRASALPSSVVKDKRDATLQKIEELVHSSPSILSSEGEFCSVASELSPFMKNNHSLLLLITNRVDHQRGLLLCMSAGQDQRSAGLIRLIVLSTSLQLQPLGWSLDAQRTGRCFPLPLN